MKAILLLLLVFVFGSEAHPHALRHGRKLETADSNDWTNSDVGGVKSKKSKKIKGSKDKKGKLSKTSKLSKTGKSTTKVTKKSMIPGKKSSEATAGLLEVTIIPGTDFLNDTTAADAMSVTSSPADQVLELKGTPKVPSTADPPSDTHGSGDGDAGSISELTSEFNGADDGGCTCTPFVYDFTCKLHHHPRSTLFD